MKKSAKSFLWGVLVVLVVLGGAWYLKGGETPSLDATGLITSSANEATLIQPAIKASARNVYNDTILGGSDTYYIISGGNEVKASGTLGTAFNLAKGSQYEVLFDDGQHYYGRVKGSAPVSGQADVQLLMSPNGTLSSVFYNAAGTAATAQALGAADEKFVKVQLTATNDKVFSNPDSDKNPIICIDYNTTEIDKIEVVGASSVGIPQQAVGTYESCYSAPFNTLKDGGETTVQFLMDADDTLNPGCATDPTAIIYDEDLYLKTTAPVGARAFGVENDAGTDIGGINPTVTLDCS